jgi:hypothetical protein
MRTASYSIHQKTKGVAVMTMHQFDFETIHLQVLHLSLDLLINMDNLPDVSTKLKQEHRAAAEKLFSVFDIAIAMDSINLNVNADEHESIMDYITNFKPTQK